MENLFIIVGALGLLMITCGVVLKKRIIQDGLYLGGGIALLIYSVHIRDVIFIVLQSIFIIAALVDNVNIHLKPKKRR